MITIKIVFLDVDGELTYSDYKNEKTANIDIEKVKLLKEICDKTDAKVVISSSWRGGEDYCKSFEEYDGMAINYFKSVISIVGSSIPKDCEILNLKYDERHLSCDLKHKDCWIEKKLSYSTKFRYDI